MSGTISTALTLGVSLTTSPTTITGSGSVTTAIGNAITGPALLAPVSGWTIINEGSVTASAAQANGIDLATGGSVSNAGLISGYQNQINTSGGFTTVTNSGTIKSSPTKIVNNAPNNVYDGIYLGAGASVTNSDPGTIFGGISGIDIAGGAGTVNNTGLIETTTLQGNGVALENGGTVINSGSTGIYGDFSGVAVYGGPGVITNSAMISAVGLNGDGVYLAAGGTITNTASGSITGTYDGIGVGFGSATVTNAGYIYGYDVGVGLYGGGCIANLAGGEILGKSGVVVDGGTVVNAGTIAALSSGAAVTFSSGQANRLVVESGAIFTGTVTGGGSGSVLELGSEPLGTTGSLTGIGGQITGFQTITFDSGEDWSLSGSLSGFNGDTISGFAQGNSIVLSGVTGLSSSYASGTLSLTSGTTTEEISFGTALTGTLQVQPVGSDTVITLVPCFASGTRIATPEGARPVKQLEVGDLVLTVGGERPPILWKGETTVDCSQHARPGQVRPVLIAAGAFAPTVPQRDLVLSPDHAILAQGVLIPAKYLVNGTTVRQIDADRVTYQHIELARHAAIFAEGLPAESYLDIGDRAALGIGRDHEEAAA